MPVMIEFVLPFKKIIIINDRKSDFASENHDLKMITSL